MEIQALIKAFYWREIINDRATTCYRTGGLDDENAVEAKLPDDFHYIHGWADYSYRSIWISEISYAIATWCEGDFSITTHASAESYQTEVQGSHDTYTVRGRGHSALPETLPLAIAAIDAMANDWKRLKLTDVSSKTLVADSFEIADLWTAAEHYFEQNPRKSLKVSKPNGESILFAQNTLQRAKAKGH